MPEWECATCDRAKTPMDSSSQEPTICQLCYDEKEKEEAE